MSRLARGPSFAGPAGAHGTTNGCDLLLNDAPASPAADRRIVRRPRDRHCAKSHADIRATVRAQLVLTADRRLKQGRHRPSSVSPAMRSSEKCCSTWARARSGQRIAGAGAEAPAPPRGPRPGSRIARRHAPAGALAGRHVGRREHGLGHGAEIGDHDRRAHRLRLDRGRGRRPPARSRARPRPRPRERPPACRRNGRRGARRPRGPCRRSARRARAT